MQYGWIGIITSLVILPPIAGQYAAAQTADASRVQVLDAQIADARHAATAAGKAAETICYNAGYTAAGILTETGITTRSRQPPG
jgi:hypothetical protein